MRSSTSASVDNEIGPDDAPGAKAIISKMVYGVFFYWVEAIVSNNW